MTGTYKVWLRPDLAPCDLTASQWGAFLATCRKLAASHAAYSVDWQLGAPRPYVVIRAEAPPRKPCAKALKPAPLALPAPLTPQDCTKRSEAVQQALKVLRLHFKAKVSEWREGWPSGYFRRSYYDPVRVANCRKLGTALRVIHARRPLMGDVAHRSPDLTDYKILDEAMGGRVPRESKLSAHEHEVGYYLTIVRLYTGGTLGKRPVARERWYSGGHWKYKLAEPEPESAPDPLASEKWYKLAMAPKPLLRQIEEAKAEVEFWEECERLARERKCHESVKSDPPKVSPSA